MSHKLNISKYQPALTINFKVTYFLYYFQKYLNIVKFSYSSLLKCQNISSKVALK